MDNQIEYSNDPYQSDATVGKKKTNFKKQDFKKQDLRNFVKERGVRREDYNNFLISTNQVPNFQVFVNENAVRPKPSFTKSLYQIFASVFRSYYGNNRMEDIGAAWQKFKKEGEPTYLYCKTLHVVKETQDAIESYFDSLSRNDIIIKPNNSVYDNDSLEEITEQLEHMHVSTPPENGSNNLLRLKKNLIRRGNEKRKL